MCRTIRNINPIPSLKRMVILVFLCTTGFLFSLQTSAQEDCSEKLKNAEASYEGGNIENVESIVTGCLDNGGFSKAEREEAYKLLTLVGLFEDDFPKAESNMTKLLNSNPDFKPKPSDPIELKKLYDLFRIDPVLTFGLRLGLNSSYTTLLRYYSVENSTDLSDGFISSGLGFQISGALNVRIAGGLYATLEPGYTSVNFVDLGTSLYDSANIVGFTETMTKMGLSGGFSNEFNRYKSIKPTLEAGAGIFRLISSDTKITRDYLDESGSASVQESEINLNANRANTMFNLYYGAEVKFKAGSRGNIVIGVRHNIGLTNITSSRYNDNLMYRYYHILDDMTQNSIMFRVGYLQSVYRPKILKRKLKQQ